jgi:phosphate transport system substrate-binding protein
MRRTRRAFVIMAFTLVSCSSPAIPASTPTSDVITLRLHANTATMPLLNNLAVEYMRQQPGFNFDIKTGNHQAMLNLLMEGETSYFLSNHLEADSNLWAAPIGQDGIAVIVHPNTPVVELTTEQLRSIYQGQIGNWAQVGGREQPIIVVSREDGSGTRAEFEQALMGSRRTTQSAQIAPSSAAMIEIIASTPGSIGYVSMSYADSSVKALPIDSINPTLANVFNNTYPLRSTIFVIGREEPETDYRAFIAWIQSQEGQAVVAQQYAPLTSP